MYISYEISVCTNAGKQIGTVEKDHEPTECEIEDAIGSFEYGYFAYVRKTYCVLPFF